MTEQKQVRRQARGVARMQAALDAAEALIAEVGYGDLTTNAIAARAGMSPGSLYQFFSNKEAILDALVTRYLGQLGEFWQDQLRPEVADLPLTDFVSRVLDGIVEFKTPRPAFWALLHGSVVPDELAERTGQLHHRIVAGLRDLFCLRVPDLAVDRAELLATMVFTTARAAIPSVLEAEPSRQPIVLAELKAMLVRYLEPALGAE